MTRGEVYRTAERLPERRNKPGFYVIVSRSFVAENARTLLGFEPLEQTWESFGWHVQRVNHEIGIDDLAQVFDNARHTDFRGPRVILFDSLMGKGVSFLESRESNHFLRVDPPEWQRALDELDAVQTLDPS